MLETSFWLVTGIYVGVCLALVFVVFLQRGTGGIGSALGGQAVDKALGAKSAEVWRKATAVLAALFLIGTLGLAQLTELRHEASQAQATEDAEAEGS